MKTTIAFLLLVLLSIPFAQAVDLPDEIVFKTRTETFTHEYEFALREGILYYKKIGGAWAPLVARNAKKAPKKFSEISADGSNLIAIDKHGQIFYMKANKLKWMPKWGMPIRRKLYVPENNRALAMSHRGPLVGGYEDIYGKFHKIGAGVTGVYALSADGQHITYADPWLPARFGHTVCGPKQGRFISEAMSASGSTLFVINKAAEMYTRLADFDTLGNNPFLRYTFKKEGRKWLRSLRALPGEDWFLQPRIEGTPSKKITILQTGRGNSGRELRVEGMDTNGRSGYFKKAIFDSQWAFIPTGHKIFEPLMNEKEELGVSAARDFHEGMMNVKGIGEIKASLMDYNPGCGPSRLILKLGGEELELAIHHFEGLFKEKAYLIMPDKALLPQNEQTQKLIKNVFRGRHKISVKVQSDKSGLTIKSKLFPLRSRFTIHF